MSEQTCQGAKCQRLFTPSTHNQKYCGSECKQEAQNEAKRLRRRELTNDVVAALAPIYEHDQEGQLAFLRAENRRLANAVEKFKYSKLEEVEAIYKGVKDATSQLDFSKIPMPPKDSRNHGEEVAVVPIADLQLGKVTPTYNTEICEERMEKYAEKIIKLIEIQRSDHPVKELRIWLLGDIVEGEEIFGGQAHLIDRSLYAQVAKDGPRILGNFIRTMLTCVDKIRVVGVIGNHGRLKGLTRNAYDNESNMDRMLYKILEHIFAYEDRVSFHIPDGPGERNFYAVDTIGTYSTLLVHGDQFPAPTSLHAYLKKIMLWKGGGIEERFDDVYMGHYHQCFKHTFGNTIVRMAGSTESNNTFAQEFLGVMGRPSQPLQFVDPKRGVTAEYQVFL